MTQREKIVIVACVLLVVLILFFRVPGVPIAPGPLQLVGILRLLGTICFGLATFGVPGNLVPGGLFLWAVSFLA